MEAKLICIRAQKPKTDMKVRTATIWTGKGIKGLKKTWLNWGKF